MKQRPGYGRAASSANLFPESMRKFGLAEAYGGCEATDCSRRARVTCSECGGEHCLAHVGDHGHEGHPRPDIAADEGGSR
jgi:hypothetical protein